MILIRALNNNEILSNPVDNGLVSKQFIFNIVKSSYENGTDYHYHKLNEEEKKQYINEKIPNYIIVHKHKLEKIYQKRNKPYRETMKELLENKKPSCYIQYLEYMSTLQNHLRNGSTVSTNWISTSKDIYGVNKYYENQDNHYVAIIKSNTNGILDYDRILTVDVSDREAIAKNKYLINKTDETFVELFKCLAEYNSRYADIFKSDFTIKTNEKAPSFNFSTSSKEVCIYEYLPSTHIMAVFDALQYDLLRSGYMNTNYLNLTKKEQLIELNKLKKELLILLRKYGDEYLINIFDELYLKNKNIKKITKNEYEQEKIQQEKNKILLLAKITNGKMIK